MACEIKDVAVVGMPRCATTYLFRCIAGLKPGPGSPKGKALANLPVMKCHSLAPPDHFHDPWHEQLWEHCLNKRKVIWVFGDPIAAVISTMKHRWDRVHAKNCGCFRPLSDVDLLEEDAFNYEKMFDSWTGKKHNYPVMCIRYETMWQNRMIIERFMERQIKWNEWNPRSWSPKKLLPKFAMNQLTATYSSLMQKTETYPDVTWEDQQWGGSRVAGDFVRVEKEK